MTPASPTELFAEAARRFCEFCETRCPLHNDELVELARLLAELQRAVLDLPESFDAGDPAAEGAARPLAAGAWAAPLDRYWEISPLTLDPEEPIASSLEDDVKAIYLDMMKGLAQYDRGHAIAAAWEWRFSYWSRWGAHLVGAQRAIYFYFSSAGSGDP